MKEEGREGEREGGREGGRDGGMEGGREEESLDVKSRRHCIAIV